MQRWPVGVVGRSRARRDINETYYDCRPEQNPLLPTFIPRGLVKMGVSPHLGSESCRIRMPFAIRQHLPGNGTLASHQVIRLGYGVEPGLSHFRRVVASDGGIRVVDTNEVIV